jgi:hypothetical protein
LSLPNSYFLLTYSVFCYFPRFMSKELPIGEQVLLPVHFDGPVMLEAARALTSGFECRVRFPDGTLEEAVLSEEEATALGKTSAASPARTIKHQRVSACS